MDLKLPREQLTLTHQQDHYKTAKKLEVNESSDV
jgi:hypothetical protein